MLPLQTIWPYQSKCPNIRRANYSEPINSDEKNNEINRNENIKRVHTALTTQSGLTGVDAKIDGHDIQCFFDTGAEIVNLKSCRIRRQGNTTFQYYPHMSRLR